MSESESVAESIFSDDSDYNYIPGVYETTYERNFENEAGESSDEVVNAGLHADKPGPILNGWKSTTGKRTRKENAMRN